jgi:Glycosyl transferases group 1
VSKKSPRLLIVGMSDSPHLKNWVTGVAELEIFKSIRILPSTSIVDIHDGINLKKYVKNTIPFTGSRILKILGSGLDRMLGVSWRRLLLKLTILIFRPDIIHVHEIQHGGYIFEWPRLLKKTSRPALFCSSWGSDLVFYGTLPSHKTRLRNFLTEVEVLLAERIIEKEIARSLGFKATFIGPVYTSIGCSTQNQILVEPSNRKLIIVKGYQDLHGRALNVLHVLENMLESLEGYEVIIVSASAPVIYEAERLRTNYGLSISCIPKVTQEELGKLLRHSRLYVALSVSDGLSTMMVEAMQHGAFPIQSQNSGAPEFIQQGISGFIVDPWDFDGVRKCLLIALTDDKLVDGAVAINQATLATKYDRKKGQDILRNLYTEYLNLERLGNKN